MIVSVYAEITDQILFYYSLDSDATATLGAPDVDNGMADFVSGGLVGDGMYLFGGGAGDYLYSTPDTIIIRHNESYSMSAWINVSSTSVGSDGIISIGDTGTDFGVYYTRAQARFVTTAYWGGAYKYYNSPTGATSSGVHHVIVTWDTPNAKPEIWIDGVNVTVSVNSISGTINSALTEQVRIGQVSYYLTQNYVMDGYIDEPTLWKRKLSTSEITELYNGGDGMTISYASVSIDSPANDYITSTPFNTTFTVSGLTDGICNVSINGTLIYTNNSISSGTDRIEINQSIWSEGYNNISVLCYKDTVSVQDEITVFVDSINPLIQYAKVIQADGDMFDINGSTIDDDFQFNISVINSNLYSFNISVCHDTGSGINLSDCELEFYVDDLGGTNYIYNATEEVNTFQFEGQHDFYMEVCDSHTGRVIPDLPVQAVAKGLNIRGTTYELVGGPPIFAQAEKKTDRYSFTFRTPVRNKDFKIDVTDTEKIHIISNRGYPGHLVHGDRWTDFESLDAEVLKVERISDYKVRVYLRPKHDTDTFLFQSTGIINCMSRIDIATINQDEINITLNSPDGDNFIVNNTDRLTQFNYTPNTIENIRNCSLYVDGIKTAFDNTITKNVVNSFWANVSYPDPQENQTYNWTIQCDQYHLHPPDNSHTLTSFSAPNQFNMFNEYVVPPTEVVVGVDFDTCIYNENPYIKTALPFSERDQILWYCTFNTSYDKKCYTYVERSGQLIQANPDRMNVDAIGIIDYFAISRGGTVSFTSQDIVPNFKYNFSVSCNAGNTTSTFKAEVTPVDRMMEDIVVPKAIYIKNSAYALILLILLVSLAIIIYRMVNK